jgi:ring-1,2-phenylacetyl-CoA epoxidase subunit PaaC
VITPRSSSPPPLRSSDEQLRGDPDRRGAGHFSYVVALADDALISAQRLGWWISRAPQLEEDVALANIGLDLLGQARALLTYAGQADGRSEDDLAYLRDAGEFRNVRLVEDSDGGDFARCVARLLVFSSYQAELYARLASSADPTLAAVAAKAVKEVAYHRDHATQWVLRLGDGTDESHRRMQVAVDAVWTYVAELFEVDDVVRALPGVAVDPAALREPALAYVRDVLGRATLRVPEVQPAPGSGRRGAHTAALAPMLAEMQELHRSMPGVTW